MTNTYNTLNPLGSTSAKDLSDNSSNFDEGINSLSPSFYDRFMRRRETWAGMEKMVHDFLEAMGFEATHLVYVDGSPLTVLRPTQLIDRVGSTYKVKQPAVFPVTLSGTWATDATLLTDVGDLAILSLFSASNGAGLVGFGATTVEGRLSQDVLLSDYAPSSGTDWTAAFVEATTAAVGLGGVLRIPAGLNIQLGPVNVLCSVVSDGAKVTRKAGTTGTWLTVGANDIRVSGLNLDGAGILAEGFRINGQSGVCIEDNTITNVYDYAVKFNAADGLTVRRNKVSAGYNGLSNDSIGASATQGLDIYDNHIFDMSGSAIYLSGETNGSDPLYFKNHMLIFDARVTGNKFNDIAGHGIIGQAYGLVIANNQFKDCGSGPGLQSIVPQGYQVSVTGNTVDGGSGVGIDMGWCNVATVSGNTVRGAGQIGIELQSCFALTCVGNALEDCGLLESSTASSGIRIAQGFFGAGSTSFGVTVSGNTIRSGGAAGRFGISIGEGVKNLIVCGNHLALSAAEQTLFMGSGCDALVYGNLQDNTKEDTFTLVTNGEGKMEMQSTTGNQDYYVTAQGSGRLRVGYNVPVASSPGSFTATNRLEIKDADGTVWHIPARLSAW